MVFGTSVVTGKDVVISDAAGFSVVTGTSVTGRPSETSVVR